MRDYPMLWPLGHNLVQTAMKHVEKLAIPLNGKRWEKNLVLNLKGKKVVCHKLFKQITVNESQINRKECCYKVKQNVRLLQCGVSVEPYAVIGLEKPNTGSISTASSQVPLHTHGHKQEPSSLEKQECCLGMTFGASSSINYPMTEKIGLVL